MEQFEVSPSTFLALALSAVVASEGTATAIPAPVNWVASPLLAAAPEQLALVKISTRLGRPAPSVPITLGPALLEGLAGSVAVICGASTTSGSHVTRTATVAVEPPFRV